MNTKLVLMAALLLTSLSACQVGSGTPSAPGATQPTVEPSAEASAEPSAEPSAEATAEPSAEPSAEASATPAA